MVLLRLVGMPIILTKKVIVDLPLITKYLGFIPLHSVELANSDSAKYGYIISTWASGNACYPDKS